MAGTSSSVTVTLQGCPALTSKPEATQESLEG
jgi:hypothetical protein